MKKKTLAKGQTARKPKAKVMAQTESFDHPSLVARAYSSNQSAGYVEAKIEKPGKAALANTTLMSVELPPQDLPAIKALKKTLGEQFIDLAQAAEES